MSGPKTAPDVLVGEPPFLLETLAADLEGEARRVLAHRARFTIAIPGGSVAAAFFPRFTSLDLDWSMVEFFWVDERAVPATSPESNYAAARTLWLAPAGVPVECIHRMRGEEADLERAARDYADELERVAGTPARLDYVLLGVGPDGHVASLFPGHPALDQAGPVLAIADAPKPPPRRLSLSLPTLVNARRVVVVAVGEQKAIAIRDAVSDPASMLPVARVARATRRCTFMLDRAAAGRT